MSLELAKSNLLEYKPKIDLENKENLEIMATYLNKFEEYIKSKKFEEDFDKVCKIIPLNDVFRDHLISRKDNIYFKNIRKELNFFLYYLAFLYKKSPEKFDETLKKLNLSEKDMIEIGYASWKAPSIESFIEYTKSYQKEKAKVELFFLSMELWYIETNEEDKELIEAYKKDILK